MKEFLMVSGIAFWIVGLVICAGVVIFFLTDNSNEDDPNVRSE